MTKTDVLWHRFFRESEVIEVRSASYIKGLRPFNGRSDSGAAAVEMALVLPILLLVIFGMVDFGRAFNAQMQITQAAREAVRVKAMFGTTADANARVAASTGGLNTPLPTISTLTSCSAGDSTSNASVTVTYQYSFITPVGPLARLFGASTIPDVGAVKTLSSTGVMRCAG